MARRHEFDEGCIVAQRLKVWTFVDLQPAAVSLAERFPQERHGAITLTEESCDGCKPIGVPTVQVWPLPLVQPLGRVGRASPVQSPCGDYAQITGVLQ